MNKSILKTIRIILPLILGVVGGYLYYDFIGCNNGCSITSNPFSSMAYGALIGTVLTDWKSGIQLIKNKRIEDEKKHGNNGSPYQDFAGYSGRCTLFYQTDFGDGSDHPGYPCHYLASDKPGQFLPGLLAV